MYLSDVKLIAPVFSNGLNLHEKFKLIRTIGAKKLDRKINQKRGSIVRISRPSINKSNKNDFV